MDKKIMLILAFLLFLPLAQATVTCTPSTISTTYTSGQSVGNQSMFCVNSENSTVTLSKVGSYFDISQSSIGSLAQAEIKVSFSSSAPYGIYHNLIYFSDSSSTIPVNLNVNQAQQQTSSDCNIDIFPTTLTNIKIPQGEVRNRQILVTVPSCYLGKISFRGVNLDSNTAPIELGELSLGDISPGNSVNVPLVFDARDSPKGTYYENLQFNMANTSGIRLNVQSVSISVMITSGITPLTNNTFDSTPTCSVSSTSMQLNRTEKLICTNIHPDIEIMVSPNEFFKGLNVEETSNQWTYNFQPIKTGDTVFKYYYMYKGAQIGNLNSQDIKIVTGGVAIPGTYLIPQFFPSDPSSAPSGSTISVLARDNKTGGLIPDFQVWLNGQKLTGNSFAVESGNQYSVNLVSSGYASSETIFTLSPKSISMSISPSEELEVGMNVTIITTPENATITINGNPSEKNFVVSSLGTYYVSASYSGYNPVNKTLVVVEPLRIVHFPEQDQNDANDNPLFPKNKMSKGKKYTIETNRDAGNYILSVIDGAKITDITTSSIKSGNIISFATNDKGEYHLDVITSSETTRLWTQSTGGFTFPDWGFYVLGGIAVLVILYLVKNIFSSGGKSGNPVAFELSKPSS